jgi:hypothetical protein
VSLTHLYGAAPELDISSRGTIIVSSTETKKSFFGTLAETRTGQGAFAFNTEKVFRDWIGEKPAVVEVSFLPNMGLPTRLFLALRATGR